MGEYREERVNSLARHFAGSKTAASQEEAVETELEDYDNGNQTVTEVTSRFGLSVFFLDFNLTSAFAIMLTGSMLLSQILSSSSVQCSAGVFRLNSMIPALLRHEQASGDLAVHHNHAACRNNTADYVCALVLSFRWLHYDCQRQTVRW